MAIALDTTTKSAMTTGTSVTWAHTVTGSNTIGFAGVQLGGTASDLLTGITFNGSAMTAAGAGKLQVPLDAYIYLRYIIAPTTGNIVASFSGTATDAYGYGATYTGAAQTGQPDATGTNTDNGGTGVTTSVTTVADNCWLVGVGATSQNTATASTNATQRQQGNGGVSGIFVDSNAAQTPAGSKSMAIIRSPATATRSGLIVASFSPVAGASGPANLKSLDTNVKANIKSYNTNVLANIKSINTNA